MIVQVVTFVPEATDKVLLSGTKGNLDIGGLDLVVQLQV